LVPKSDKSKQIAIVFIPLVCGIMAQLLAIAAGRIIEVRSSRFRRQLEQKGLTEEDLQIMDADGDGRVSKVEFLAFMLVAMKKIDKDLVDELDQYFERLDTDRSGYLSREDLIETARRKLRNDPIQCMQRLLYKQQLLSKSKRTHHDAQDSSSV
jgi:potassium channel subfamily K